MEPQEWKPNDIAPLRSTSTDEEENFDLVLDITKVLELIIENGFPIPPITKCYLQSIDCVFNTDIIQFYIEEGNYEIHEFVVKLMHHNWKFLVVNDEVFDLTLRTILRKGYASPSRKYQRAQYLFEIANFELQKKDIRELKAWNYFMEAFKEWKKTEFIIDIFMLICNRYDTIPESYCSIETALLLFQTACKKKAPHSAKCIKMAIEFSRSACKIHEVFPLMDIPSILFQNECDINELAQIACWFINCDSNAPEIIINSIREHMTLYEFVITVSNNSFEDKKSITKILCELCKTKWKKLILIDEAFDDFIAMFTLIAECIPVEIINIFRQILPCIVSYSEETTEFFKTLFDIAHECDQIEDEIEENLEELEKLFDAKINI